MAEDLHPPEVYLKRISDDMKLVRIQLTEAVNALRHAESEIHEKMRRFANYYHDIVHIKGEYVSLGLKAPAHVDREMERCDDRFRQLLRSGCLIFSGTRQKNAVQAVFSCDRSPEGAAQAHERSDHGMKLGIVNHLVNAFTGNEQLPRQWRLERQVLPFLRGFISLRFPDQPAQARR